MEPLTDSERLCLLRAARRAVLEMGDEAHRLETLANHGVKGMWVAHGIVLEEMQCLSHAIAKLWDHRS
jgi:hypothetical protein